MTLVPTPPSLSGLDDDDMEAIIAGLPASEVAAFCHAAETWRKTAAKLRDMAESRILGESLMVTGEVWTAPDGTDYQWADDRERVCSDPAALRTALEAENLSGIAKKALKDAFKDQPPKVYLTHLNTVEKFGGEEVGRIIRSFVSWKSGRFHLRPVEK